MIDYSQSPEKTLRRYAEQLDALRERKLSAQPLYDCMGDALVWADEAPAGNPSDLIGPLRMLRYHRTGLIIGQTRPGADLWELGIELFPHWVGFHPSRCMPSLQLASVYHAYAFSFKRE